MLQLLVWLRNWLTRQEGQDLAEYALLIGLIALVVVVAVTALGGSISTVFSEIAATIAGW